jgi:hypothetical protein
LTGLRRRQLGASPHGRRRSRRSPEVRSRAGRTSGWTSRSVRDGSPAPLKPSSPPNFHFHAVAACGIFRTRGVPSGKAARVRADAAAASPRSPNRKDGAASVPRAQAFEERGRGRRTWAGTT